MPIEAGPEKLGRRDFLRKAAAAGAALTGLGLMNPDSASAGVLKETQDIAPGAVKSIHTEDPDTRIKLKVMPGDELVTLRHYKPSTIVGTHVRLRKGDIVVSGGKRHVLTEDRSTSINGVTVIVGSERELSLPPKIVALVHGGDEGRGLDYSFRQPRELNRLGKLVDIRHVSGDNRTKEEREAATARKVEHLKKGVRAVKEACAKNNTPVEFILHKNRSITVAGLEKYGITEGAKLRIGPYDSTEIELSSDDGKTWTKCPYPGTPEYNKADIQHSYRLLWSVVSENGIYRLQTETGISQFRPRQPPRSGH